MQKWASQDIKNQHRSHGLSEQLRRLQERSQELLVELDAEKQILGNVLLQFGATEIADKDHLAECKAQLSQREQELQRQESS